MPLLDVRGLNAGYGKLHVLWDIDIYIDAGEKVALIGPNGAGKTTLLRSIMGLTTLFSGRIIYNGEDITNLPTFMRARSGITLVPEGSRVFPKLTVLENLLVATTTEESKKKIEDSLDFVFTLFPILKERKDQLAGTLSGGEQRMLAIARGLMTRPKLLMVDELSLGLAPKVVSSLYIALGEVHKYGITLLIVEQYVKKALEFSERAYLIEKGRIVKHGRGDELLADRYIREVYIG